MRWSSRRGDGQLKGSSPGPEAYTTCVDVNSLVSFEGVPLALVDPWAQPDAQGGEFQSSALGRIKNRAQLKSTFRGVAPIHIPVTVYLVQTRDRIDKQRRHECDSGYGIVE
jgi:hypothetical protein